MKKILIIILITFITSGCSDYKELNTMSYIIGIAMDYQDGEYLTYYEVMDNKLEGGSMTVSTYIVSGTGETRYEAKMDATSKLDKTAYFAHTQILLLSENIIEHKLFDVTDTIMRNPKLNEEILLVMTKDDPKEIFETSSETFPSASLYIFDLVSTNNYSKNFYINEPFALFVQKINENNHSPILTSIKIDDDEIITDEAGIFNDNKLVSYIPTKLSNLYNGLINSKLQIPINTELDGDSLETATQIKDFSFNVTSSKITIDITAYAELKKSPENFNLNDESSYVEIEKKLEKELHENLEELISTLQKNNSDLFGFEKSYYIKTRKNNNDLWTNANVEINIDVSVSRKGIIYNVNN